MTRVALNRSLPARGARWGQQRRLEFIDFRLMWEGRVNRGQLVEFFGISTPQASLDLAQYIQVAPQNIEYDKSEKTYKATANFSPVISANDSQVYLNQLFAVAGGLVPAAQSTIGWHPPNEIVRFPTRAISTEILASGLRAIRESSEIEVSYQSMREPDLTRRWIAPHSIAFDGGRWHFRAYCFQTSKFRDFVLARIQKIYGSRRGEVDPNKDFEWHQISTLTFRPREQLSDQQRRAIEREYAMKSGCLQVQIRNALVYYFVRQLDLHHSQDPPRHSQPLEWVNRSEFNELLTASRK